MAPLAIIANRNYKLVILDYMVTYHHIHLVVVEDGDQDVIPRSSSQVIPVKTVIEHVAVDKISVCNLYLINRFNALSYFLPMMLSNSVGYHWLFCL